MSEQRLLFFDWLKRQAGAPYLWGAKGLQVRPLVGEPIVTYDCSGLVTCGLLAVGWKDWRNTHNAQMLFDELESLDEDEQPAPCDLVFYGQPAHVSHVMVWMGDGTVYGACGGNQSCTTLEVSRRMDARVKPRSSITYRPDFRGFRRFPLP